jgi:hypothetical protein
MAQIQPRYCPRCGAPIVTKSRNCATCGLTAEAMLSSRTHIRPTQDYQQEQQQLPHADRQASQDHPHIQQGYQQLSMQASQAGQEGYPYARRQSLQEQVEQDSAFSSPARLGRKGFLLLLLALLVLLGATSYVIAGFLGVHLPGFANSSVQPPVTTMAINSSVPYAGIDITVLNAQQSEGFIDDPYSRTSGMVRLNLKEQNNTASRVTWGYYNIARLVLPNKSIVSPIHVKAKVGIAPGTSQMSVIDFAVPTSDHIGQLTLRLGATNEAQMLIPLTGKANLSKYQPKTIHLNGQMQYFGLNWTLTAATSSLSLDGQQAASGMRYIIVKLSVDSTLSQLAITGSPYDYIRLKFGNTTASPKDTTLPISFDPGATGVAGTVSFLVPQNTKALTLILLPQRQSGSDLASTNFQLPI